MKLQKYYTTTIKQLIAIAALFVFILLISLFRQKPDWVEKYYFSGLYPGICYLLHPLFGLIPLSIGDIFYTVIVFFLIAGIVTFFILIFKGNFKPASGLLLRFVIWIQAGWICFYLLWGMNYYRPPAAELLQLNDTSYTIKDVDKVTALLIDSANACRSRLDTLDLHPSNTLIYKTAIDAVKHLSLSSPKFKAISPRIKPSWFTKLLNYIGTSGYFNPFTGEAQLNYMMPVFDRPFVACHEMGHQTGWAREDEANFAGFVAATQSNDNLLRYSAYYEGVEEFMRYIRRRDSVTHHALRLKISPLVRQDLKTDSAYWVKYEGGAEVMSGIFFDKFLKANNQPHGLRTYNRMILLTMAYYRKRYRVW